MRKTTYLALCVFWIANTSLGMCEGFSFDLGKGPSLSGKILQLISIVTILSIAPSILVMVTSFTRIVVVMSLLRNALGLNQSPPNALLVSLSLFLTAFVMGPVIETSYTEGVAPYLEEKLSNEEAWQKTTQPLYRFMKAHVRPKDLALFSDIQTKNPSPLDASLGAMIPAFMISELRRAFEIGFLLFIPFLVIDMVVASVLMSMGMMMLPPATLSLPFKIIFFVLVDGWYLLAGSLLKSYGIVASG